MEIVYLEELIKFKACFKNMPFIIMWVIKNYVSTTQIGVHGVHRDHGASRPFYVWIFSFDVQYFFEFTGHYGEGFSNPELFVQIRELHFDCVR